MTDIEVDDILQEHLQEDEYIDESDDDLTNLMRDDEELEEIMETVFGEASDEEL